MRPRHARAITYASKSRYFLHNFECPRLPKFQVSCCTPLPTSSLRGASLVSRVPSVAATASPRCRGGHGKAVRCGGGVCCGVRRVRRWRGVEQFGAHRDGVALLCYGFALRCHGALQGLARRRGTACACAWRDTLNVACARGCSCLRALARLGARLGGRARGESAGSKDWAF